MKMINSLIIKLESFITLYGTNGVLAIGLGLIVSICIAGIGRK